MTDIQILWPGATAIRHAINWNRAQQQRAQRDAGQATRVPRSATRRLYRGGRPVTERLTLDEYRASRAADAGRFARNIEALEARR